MEDTSLHNTVATLGHARTTVYEYVKVERLKSWRQTIRGQVVKLKKNFKDETIKRTASSWWSYIMIIHSLKLHRGYFLPVRLPERWMFTSWLCWGTCIISVFLAWERSNSLFRVARARQSFAPPLRVQRGVCENLAPESQMSGCLWGANGPW